MILHTEVFGNGDPLIFLHTGLQTGLTDFEAQREVFRKSNKVILPDLRGHGKSIHDDISNYFENTAKDLKDTLDHLGVENCHLIGCSLGGLVGLVFAKKYPDRLKSLTLSGVTADRPDDWGKTHAQEVEFQKSLLKNAEAVNHFDKMHDSDWRKILYMAENEDWYPFEYTSDLANINVPILFMVGEGKKHEVASASKYQNMHENVHVSVIPFASHLVHVQKPELYNKTLKEFLMEVENKL